MVLRRLALLLPPCALALLGPVSVLAAVHHVQMTTENFEPRFVPAEITIRPGDTVRWTNTDAFHDHSTVSGTGSLDPNAGALWNSGILRLGQTFEHRFDDVGRFEYFSLPHEVEGMFGVVTVSDGTPVPEGVELSTWGKIKSEFSRVLPNK
jgi:plastocyanin